MNRRRRASFTASIAVVITFSTLGSRPVIAQMGGIPDAARKGATSAAVEEHLPAIEAFVRGHVSGLADASPHVRAAARRALVNQVVTGDPSNMFLFNYGKVIEREFGPLVKHESLPVRLNAAIAVAEIAKRLPSTQMSPMAQAFMQDEATPVALWGMKAATGMLPVILGQPGARSDPLVTAIAQCFGTHPTGPMADEAYHALSLDTEGVGRPPLNAAQLGAAAPIVVPELIKILQMRLAQYAQGMPPDPWAETGPVNFLTRTQVWAAMSGEQRAQVVELMSALAVASATHFAEQDKQREQLAPLLERLGQAFTVVGGTVNSKPLQDAGTALAATSAASRPDAVTAAASAIGPAVKSVPQFKDVVITSSNAQ